MFNVISGTRSEFVRGAFSLFLFPSTTKEITPIITYDKLFVMKVYIEFVIIDNIVLTSSIAGLSYASVGMRVHKRRTAVAAAIGTVISVFYPFLTLATPLLIVAKLTVGVLLGIILFARLQKPVLGVVLFFVQTAVVGGLCIFVNYLITGDIGDALTGTPILPYCVPSAIGAALFFVARYAFRAAKRRRTEASFVYDVEVTVGGTTVVMKGYLDSGNFLYDEKTSLPVVIVKLSSLYRAFGRDKTIASIEGYKIAQSIGSIRTKLFLIKPDKFILYSEQKMNKHSDVMLGATETDFSRKEDMLLHPSVIGG